MGKRVTIQDIADALGISRNTVSKAINNSDGLADATREKILQKAVEMFDRGYDEMVCSLGLPVLFVDAPPYRSGDTLPADHLYMDNASGVMQLVNAAIARGIRKIGFIGDWDHCQSFFERYCV